MVLSHWFMGMFGLFGGIVIASGLVALLIGLKIIPRYAGITRTANHILLYENCAMAGAFMGNLATVYEWNLHMGSWVGGVIGIFGGIFLGGWIIALTEVMDIMPIMARRTGLTRGIGLVIVSAAVGKTLWSLLYYYKGW